MEPPDIDDMAGAFEFSPDSKSIVSVTDNTIQIRDAVTGLIKLDIVGDSANPYRGTPKFSRDGQMIAVIVTDRTFNFYDAESGDLIQSRIFEEGMIYGFAYKPDGKALAVRLNTAEEHSTSSENYPNKLLILDIQTGDETALITEPNPGLLQLTFSHDGKMIAGFSPTKGGKINIWETTSGKLIKTHTVNSNQSISEIVFSPDNSKIFYQSHFFKQVGEFQDVTNQFFVKAFDIKTGSIVKDKMFCAFTRGCCRLVNTHWN